MTAASITRASDLTKLTLVVLRAVHEVGTPTASRDAIRQIVPCSDAGLTRALNTLRRHGLVELGAWPALLNLVTRAGHQVLDEHYHRSPRCRACGCTQNVACDGGCSWAEPDLCSSCATEVLF
jgi:hypothetical protein